MLTTSTLSDESPGILRILRETARDIRHSRSLIFQLTLRDIRVRYKQAAMGFAWAILSPLLVIGAGMIVRVALVNMAGQHLDTSAATGLVVKALAWAFVSSAVGFSSTALTSNAALISKVYFPRETLPLSIVLASSFDALISTTALWMLLPLTGWRPTWAILWVPVLAAVLFTLVLGVALAVSCANLFFRDVKYIVQLVISFGIFFTPVFFEPSIFGGRWIAVQMLNPLAPVFEGLRLSVVNGHNLMHTIAQPAGGAIIWSPYYLYYSAIWAVVGLLASAVIFHRAQYRFAEYV